MMQTNMRNSKRNFLLGIIVWPPPQGAHPGGELEGGGRVRGGAEKEVQRHPQAPRVSKIFKRKYVWSGRFDSICYTSKKQQKL